MTPRRRSSSPGAHPTPSTAPIPAAASSAAPTAANRQTAGNVGAPAVNELAIDADGTIYAAIPGGEVKRSTDGGATWTRLVKLK